MDAMRLLVSSYNEKKECQGCPLQDENQIAAYILSFQLADHFLNRFSGNWKLTKEELILHLQEVEDPLIFELSTGTLAYGTLRTPIVARYSPKNGLTKLAEDILRDFALPLREFQTHRDPLFQIFVKLIEIFHARCGLTIQSVEREDRVIGWELSISENGPRGWLSSTGILENRFGERTNIYHWIALRPEKLAAYIFGFNQFCSHYPSPLKKEN